MTNGLTEKQRRFVSEYLVDLNATAAARRAGYSVRTADRIGPELLGKTCVSAAIRKALKARSEHTGITQSMVIEELAAIGFANGTNFAQINENGHVELTPTGRLSKRQRAAVVGVKETQFGVEIKLADKTKALELLGRHLGLFEGKGGQSAGRKNNLLDAIADRAGEEVNADDLPEVQ